MKCDVIAEGIVEACRHVKLTVPLIVRMKGTHEKEGKEILKNSGLPIISAESLGDAAKKGRRTGSGEIHEHLVNKNSRIITQGMTGKTGQFHTRLCRDYGFGKECFAAV